MTFDTTCLKSNTFEIELPPKSGQILTFPEVDRAEWFELTRARTKLAAAQAVFIDRLADKLGFAIPDTPEQSSLF